MIVKAAVVISVLAKCMLVIKFAIPAMVMWAVSDTMLMLHNNGLGDKWQAFLYGFYVASNVVGVLVWTMA